jgi:hypothetical protein
MTAQPVKQLVPDGFFDAAPGSRLLDVAAGGGHFVYDQRQRGVEAWGVDLVANEIPKFAAHMIQADLADRHFLPRVRERGPYQRATSNFGPFYYWDTPDEVLVGILRHVHEVLETGAELRIYPTTQIDRIRTLLSQVPGFELAAHDVHEQGSGKNKNHGSGWAILRRRD